VAVTGFNTLLQTMAEADFFTGILPFLLSYVLFYGALDKVPIFNDKEHQRFKPLVAIVFAFFVARFLVVNPAYQGFFVEYFGRVVIGLTGILGLMVLLGFVGWDGKKIQSPLMAIIVLIMVLGAWTISGGAFAFLPESQLPVIGISISQISSVLFENGIIYLIVIGVALYWVSGEADKEDEDDSADNIDKLNKLLGLD